MRRLLRERRPERALFPLEKALQTGVPEEKQKEDREELDVGNPSKLLDQLGLAVVDESKRPRLPRPVDADGRVDLVEAPHDLLNARDLRRNGSALRSSLEHGIGNGLGWNPDLLPRAQGSGDI